MKKTVGIFFFGIISFLGYTQDITSAIFEQWNWRLIGPSMPSGRSWTVIGSEHDSRVIFATTAGGGVWKSTNNGVTFKSVFDHENSASTGTVTIAKSDENIVWVGTGEPASTRATSWGDGVYKSKDGGESWTNMGLHDSYNIAEIVIHPTDPDIVYVAAMGHLWGPNAERGVFRTKDGGENWEKVLYVNDTTGAIDIKMNPKNPNVLYASTWERIRFGGGDMDEAGKGSLIWRSNDGGTTWNRIMNGIPVEDDLAKIQLAVGHKDTSIVYATVNTGEPSGWRKRSSNKGGVFRSDDGGANWKRVNDKQSSYFYQRIYTDPSDDETIWMPYLTLFKSDDGGKTIEEVNMKHVHYDLHSIWIDPKDQNHLIISGDGGVHVSFDRGETWMQTILPIGQFYEVSVDNQTPYHVIGGMQETGLWIGPSRTYDIEGITQNDWYKLRSVGDGMGSVTDSRDPNTIYMAIEHGGLSRLDLRNWDRQRLVPNSEELKAKGLNNVRHNWTAPFIQSKHDQDYLYFASNYVYRIKAATGEYEIISEDLSWQKERDFIGIIGGSHGYGAVFSLAESYQDPNVLWAGSDDGYVWKTEDRGVKWKRLNKDFPDGTPILCVISEIELSRFSADRAYVTMDGHAKNDHSPYVYKTEDGGKTWESISNNLPGNHPVYTIKEDPKNENVLYLGTEFGVFVSLDRGGEWHKMNGNLPTSGVRSIAIQERDMDMVVATFGRAIWVTDISAIHQMKPEELKNPLTVFDIENTIKFKPRVTYGNWIEELNGDNLFRAENPPYGMAINVYLRDSVSEVTIKVMNASRKIIGETTVPAHQGFNTVYWDLKTKEHTGKKHRGYDQTLGEWIGEVTVPPGNYYITIRAGGDQVTKAGRILPEPVDGVKQVYPRK